MASEMRELKYEIRLKCHATIRKNNNGNLFNFVDNLTDRFFCT